METVTQGMKYRQPLVCYAKEYVANIPKFEACLTMLQNWGQYILNAFDCPYSNGFTEGVNNTIKVIKRIGYGYRNFSNFRACILAIVNT